MSTTKAAWVQEKVTALRTQYDAFCAIGLGRPLADENTHDGTPDGVVAARLAALDDARLVADAARRTIAGIPKHRSRAGCRRHLKSWTPGDPCCEDHDLTPQVWHDLADLAGLAPDRHPSVSTIVELVAQLDVRVRVLSIPLAEIFREAGAA